MDVPVAAATMDSEETLAATTPDSPIATTTVAMETASPAGSNHAATSGREAKPKAPKKLLSKEKKGVETAKRHGRRKNLKKRNAAAAAVLQAGRSEMAWQMQVKACAHVDLHPSLTDYRVVDAVTLLTTHPTIEK
jgi:hypothetical protein